MLPVVPSRYRTVVRPRRVEACARMSGMPAHLIVHGDVHDAAGYEEDEHRAAPVVARRAERHLARGGAVAPLEGEWLPRLAVVRSLGYHAALRFDHSPGYQEAAPVRRRCSRSALAIVDGG